MMQESASCSDEKVMYLTVRGGGGSYAQQLCSFSTSCALLFRMIFLILPYCPNMVEERSVASFASEGARPMMYTKHRWMMRTLCR